MQIRMDMGGQAAMVEYDHCDRCGRPVYGYYTVCRECRRKEDNRLRRLRLAKERRKDSGGM